MSSGANRSRVGVSLNYLRKDYELADMVKGAKLAEELGFDVVWLHDAMLGRRTMATWDPVSIMSTIAAETEEIELATGILQPHLRNPIVLAQRWATMDELSGGRSIMGVGTGAGVKKLTDRQYQTVAALGGDPDELYERRGRLYEEAVEIIRRLWRGEKFSYDGEFYQFEDVTIGGAAPTKTPPIIMAQGHYFEDESGGGATEHHWSENSAGQFLLGTYERVSHFGDGWTVAQPTPEEYRECWGKIAGELEDIGRDPSEFIQTLNCFVHVDPDEEKARAAVKTHLENFHGPPIHDDLVDRWGYAGSGEQIAERLDDYLEQGVELFQFVVAAENQFEQMRTMSDELLPRL